VDQAAHYVQVLCQNQKAWVVQIHLEASLVVQVVAFLVDLEEASSFRFEYLVEEAR